MESIGKELLDGALDVLVKKDILKLKETDKKKFNDAKHGDKARVLAKAVQQKSHEAGQVLVQTFLNTNKNAISNEGKNRADITTNFSNYLESVHTG